MVRGGLGMSGAGLCPVLLSEKHFEGSRDRGGVRRLAFRVGGDVTGFPGLFWSEGI